MQVQARPVEYKVIEGNCVTVSEKVTELLKEGWMPHGDLHCASSNLAIGLYAQAMVKIQLVPLEPPPGMTDSGIVVPQLRGR